jgi:hypothetical protein
VHPNFEEDLEGYTPDFAPEQCVQTDGHLLVKIKRYEFVVSEWIAWCEVRAQGNIKFARGTEFYIRSAELFSDFNKPDRSPLRIKRSPIYNLGSVRTAKELRSMFYGVKIPKWATPWVTELIAPDGSIWQAFKEVDTERHAIKWRCEVLPNGLSLSPRIPQKNGYPKAATISNSFY